MVKVRSYKVWAFATPLKRPFVTALGRKTETVNVGVTLRLSDGSLGYGEASASLALAHLTPDILARDITRLAAAAVGREAEPRALLPEELGPAASAFECAVLDAWTRSRGLTIREWLGGALTRLETDATISAVPPEEAREAAEAAKGFRLFKVKLGAGDDAGRIASVPGRLLLDGNQGLTVDSALRHCEDERVEAIEQPLPKDDWKGLERLCKKSRVPVILDESVQSPADAVRAASIGAAVNIKLAKSGLLRALEIGRIARPLMIGCMAETARGLSPSVQLALGTGWFRWHDLDSDWLLNGQRYDGLGWKRSKCSLEARRTAR